MLSLFLKNMQLKLYLCLMISPLFFLLGLEVGAAPPIILGQSCALTGPSKNLGLEVRAGLLAAFAKINDEGGIDGRDILLISKDDGYEPDRAVRNTKTLIEKYNIFMLIGEVGTPTSKAVIPIIEQQRIPFFAPFTGAEFLRVPFRKYVINVRPSYFEEMESWHRIWLMKKNCAVLLVFIKTTVTVLRD